MAQLMRHVGRIDNTGSRIVVVFREIPNDESFCLVVESDRLPDLYHQNLMTVVNSKEAQDTVDLNEVLARRDFGTGENILNTLHVKGYLKKIAVSSIIMLPFPNQPYPLSKINEQIRNDKGVAPVAEKVTDAPVVLDTSKDASFYIEQAKVLEEKAATLREQAYMIDPKLRPTRGRPGLSDADKEARRQERNRRRRESYQKEKTSA